MVIVAKAIVLIKVGFENEEVRLDQSEHREKAYHLNSQALTFLKAFFHQRPIGFVEFHQSEHR